jgi:hypothetical protein
MGFQNPGNPEVEQLESIRAPWGIENSSIPQRCGGLSDSGTMSGISVEGKKNCSSRTQVLSK